MKRKINFLMSILISILFFFTIVNPSFAYVDSSITHNTIQVTNRENWWWTDIELITGEFTDHSYNQKTVIDKDNILHMCWEDYTDVGGSGLDIDVYYRALNIDTNTWSAVEVVSDESTGPSQNPSIAVDNQGDVHVVYHDTTDILGAGTDADIFYKIRDSSTGIWSSAEIVSTTSTSSSYAPELALDSARNAHVVWYDNHDFDGTDVDIIYKKRDYTSETWSSPVVISTDSLTTSYNPVVGVDSLDNIHVFWYDYTSGLYGSSAFADIMYKKWDPDNLWSSGFSVSYDSLADDSYQPSLAIDDKNNLHVSWNDATDLLGSGTDRDIFYRKWDSSTNTWSNLLIISEESDLTSNRVDIAVDRDYNVHFTWQDNANIAGSGVDLDIYYKVLYRETNSLSEIVLLSELSDDHTYNPTIAIDNNDYIHLNYYDYSPLLSSGVDRDIFYRKFVGPPEAPILAEVFPSTRALGNLTLNWTSSIGATEYDVYKSNSYIWDVDEITPIGTTSDNYFEDSPDAGIYYYSIVACSDYGESDLSNVVAAEILNVECLECAPGLFDNINWGELIILGGVIIGFQLIFSVITLAITATRTPSKKRKK